LNHKDAIFSFHSSKKIIVLYPSESVVFSLSLIFQCFATISFFLSVIEAPTGNEESEDPEFFFFISGTQLGLGWWKLRQ